MKLICVDYPFGELPTCRYYPTLTQAKKDALDRYVVQEEIEDEQGDNEASVSCSRAKADVYESEIPLRKSVLCQLLNGDDRTFLCESKKINEFRYRRGKIVVSKPVVSIEFKESQG